MENAYRFIDHSNPIKTGYKGYILNENGNIFAYVKLDGRIITNKGRG